MAKVKLYTVGYCPYCKKAKKILSDKGVEFEEIDIIENEMEMRNQLSQKTGITTVPQIFINDEFIGGSEKLVKLEQSGELDKLLSA